MRLNKTGSRSETPSWEENECEFCVVVLLISQPVSYRVRSSRDVEVLPAVTDKNYSSVHSYLSLQKWGKISQFQKGYVLCACKISGALQCVFNSLFPWTAEIEKQDRNPWKGKKWGKKKRRRRKECAYLFCRSKRLKQVWLLYWKVVCGMTPLLCLVCVECA